MQTKWQEKMEKGRKKNFKKKKKKKKNKEEEESSVECGMFWSVEEVVGKKWERGKKRKEKVTCVEEKKRGEKKGNKEKRKQKRKVRVWRRKEEGKKKRMKYG